MGTRHYRKAGDNAPPAQKSFSKLDRLIMKPSISMNKYHLHGDRGRACLKHSTFFPRKDNEGMTNLATCYYRDRWVEDYVIPVHKIKETIESNYN
jgi:hypothetical protein